MRSAYVRDAIAGPVITLQTHAQRVAALLAGAVGEIFRRNPPARQPIVADGGRSVHAFFDIAGFDQVAVLPRPYTRVTICLQFHQHLKLVRPARVLLLKAAHLVGNARYRLDMVAVFVGENVIAGKIPASAQLPFQRVVETRIDIDGLVCRAIERADCRRCISASFRTDAAATEQVECRLLECVSLITKCLGPRCVE